MSCQVDPMTAYSPARDVKSNIDVMHFSVCRVKCDMLQREVIKMSQRGERHYIEISYLLAGGGPHAAKRRTNVTQDTSYACSYKPPTGGGMTNWKALPGQQTDGPLQDRNCQHPKGQKQKNVTHGPQAIPPVMKKGKVHKNGRPQTTPKAVTSLDHGSGASANLDALSPSTYWFH